MELLELFKMNTHHGVTPLLTKGAYDAFMESREYFAAHDRSYAGMNPEVWDRIAAGTLTFVRRERYNSHPMHMRVYSGTTATLDAICEHFNVTVVEETFSVPFSNGDYDYYVDQLAKGYGPHFEILAGILRAMAARLEVREAENGAFVEDVLSLPQAVTYSFKTSDVG